MSSDLALLIAGCFVAAFASGVAGFAFNLVAAGILYQWLPPQETAPVLVLGSLLVQSATLAAVRDAVRWRTLRAYVLPGLVGTPFGTLLLAAGDAASIAGGVGALLVVYSVWMLARMALRIAPRPVAAGPAADAGIGFASGVLGGVGGFSGALPTMWTDLKGLRKDEARAIYQPFIVAMQAASATALAAGGFIDARAGWALVATLPALALGAWLGMRAYRAASAERFRLVLLALLLLSGISLLV